MKLYMANPSTDGIRAKMAAGRLGAIITPSQGNKLPPETAFCIDNGCGVPGVAGAHVGAGPPPVPVRHGPRRPRRRSCGRRRSCTGSGRGSGCPWRWWPRTAWSTWTWFDVLFIGGSTEWKLGPAAAQLTAEAHARGKWVHMGRVNTRQRLRYAAHIGCDSADGTGMTRAPDKNLAQMLRWLDEIRGQLALFGSAA